MRKASLLIIFLFLLTIPVSAEVFLSPDEWEFSVTSGNGYTEEINVVRFEGNESEIGFEFEVERDGEDISEAVDIEVSPETVTLDSGESEEVTVDIETDYRLSPGPIEVSILAGPIDEEDVPEDEDEEETDETDDSDEETGGNGGQPPPDEGEEDEENGDEIGDGEEEENGEEDTGEDPIDEPTNGDEDEDVSIIEEIEEVYQEDNRTEEMIMVNIGVSFVMFTLLLLAGLL